MQSEKAFVATQRRNYDSWTMRRFLELADPVVRRAAAIVSKNVSGRGIHYDDILQQGYLVASNLLGRYEPELVTTINYKKWLLNQIVNGLLSWVRITSRCNIPIKVIHVSIIPDRPVHDDGIRELERRDCFEHIGVLLTDRQKMLLCLRFEEDMNCKRIADHLGESYCSIRREVKIAMAIIRRAIDDV